jgi:hypothetical protein
MTAETFFALGKLKLRWGDSMAKLEDITDAGVACFDCVSAALLTFVCMDREQRLNSRDRTHSKADAMHFPQ